MNKLILYNDLEGNEMVLLCTDQSFYNGVFMSTPQPEIIDEIDIDGDLVSWPTNRPLSANF